MSSNTSLEYEYSLFKAQGSSVCSVTNFVEDLTHVFKPPSSFSKILYDPLWNEVFFHFLEVQQAEENYWFYKEIEVFLQFVEFGSDIQPMKEYALNLFSIRISQRFLTNMP